DTTGPCPLPVNKIKPNTHHHFLVGPEGGFSEEEMSLVRQQGFVGFSLGPHVLRAETAAVSALACWQYAGLLAKL
ncbi:MAG: RsmE family RNA methyltransferase, partial [Pseudomonadota bacterium]